MGTRCTISMITPNGDKKGIFSRMDGYLEHTGNLLVNDWNTQKRVSELMDFGDIECLYEYPIVSSRTGKVDVRKSPKNHAGIRADIYRDSAYDYLWKDGKWYVTTFDGISENSNASKYKTVLVKNALKQEMKGYKSAVYGKKPQRDSITQLENSVRKMF